MAILQGPARGGTNTDVRMVSIRPPKSSHNEIRLVAVNIASTLADVSKILRVGAGKTIDPIPRHLSIG